VSTLDRLNLGLRVVMELGIVAGLAYWGATTGGSITWKVLLGVAVPVLGFAFWGSIDFRRAGRLSEPLRLIQELAVSGIAALALYAGGRHALSFSLAGLSIAYHALVYVSGRRLLAAGPEQELQHGRLAIPDQTGANGDEQAACKR
jgi:hypothetical protein